MQSLEFVPVRGALQVRWQSCVHDDEGELSLALPHRWRREFALPGTVGLDWPLSWEDIAEVVIYGAGPPLRFPATAFALRDGVPLVQLSASATLMGRILLPPGTPGRAVPLLHGGRNSQRVEVALARDGAFHREGCAAVPFELRFVPEGHLVTRHGVADEVFLTEGRLRAGKILDVGPITPTGLEELTDIQVLESGGRPAVGATVFVDRADRTDWRGQVDASGRAQIRLTPGIAHTVWAMRGAGWSSSPVTWQSSALGGTVELVLERR